jgi:hypothetical protein
MLQAKRLTHLDLTGTISRPVDVLKHKFAQKTQNTACCVLAFTAEIPVRPGIIWIDILRSLSQLTVVFPKSSISNVGGSSF